MQLLKGGLLLRKDGIVMNCMIQSRKNNGGFSAVVIFGVM
jgi:hypothetical protein